MLSGSDVLGALIPIRGGQPIHASVACLLDALCNLPPPVARQPDLEFAAVCLPVLSELFALLPDDLEPDGVDPLQTACNALCGLLGDLPSEAIAPLVQMVFDSPPILHRVLAFIRDPLSGNRPMRLYQALRCVCCLLYGTSAHVATMVEQHNVVPLLVSCARDSAVVVTQAMAIRALSCVVVDVPDAVFETGSIPMLLDFITAHRSHAEFAALVIQRVVQSLEGDRRFSEIGKIVHVQGALKVLCSVIEIEPRDDEQDQEAQDRECAIEAALSAVHSLLSDAVPKSAFAFHVESSVDRLYELRDEREGHISYLAGLVLDEYKRLA